MKFLHKGALSFIRYSRDYGIHQLECWRAGSTLYHFACTVISAAITMVHSIRHGAGFSMKLKTVSHFVKLF